MLHLEALKTACKYPKETLGQVEIEKKQKKSYDFLLDFLNVPFEEPKN